MRHELPHRLETGSDGPERHEGPEDPLSQQTAPHYGDGPIQDRQEGGVLLTGVVAGQRPGQFQVSDGGTVQVHLTVRVADPEAVQMAETGAGLSLSEIPHRRPGRLDAEGQAAAPEPVQGADSELLSQRALCARQVEEGRILRTEAWASEPGEQSLDLRRQLVRVQEFPRLQT